MDDQCSEVNKKAVLVSYIPDQYIDGSCIKEGGGNGSIKYYCVEENWVFFLY